MIITVWFHKANAEGLQVAQLTWEPSERVSSIQSCLADVIQKIKWAAVAASMPEKFQIA